MLVAALLLFWRVACDGEVGHVTDAAVLLLLLELSSSSLCLLHVSHRSGFYAV